LSDRIRLMIVHPDLESGGAERQIVQLCQKIDKKKFEVFLVLYRESGQFAGELKNIPDVTVIILEEKELLGRVARIPHLVGVIKKFRPTIVYSYLENVNVIVGICSIFCRIPRLVWGIRVSKFSTETRTFQDKVVHRLACVFSQYVDLVISNNSRGLRQFCENGYRPRASEIIPNGINASWFNVAPDLSAPVRRELAIPEGTILIGQLARVVKEKGYDTLLRAMSRLREDYQITNVVLICAGRGNQSLIEEYKRLQVRTNLDSRVFWLGDRIDSRAVLAACDIVTLASSEGDGFPNVVGEALALEKPVVVTDVGDCLENFGSSAIVVEPNNPDAIARAWNQIIGNPSEARALGKQGRRLILNKYSVAKNISNTEKALLDLC
jgi:glycosyltransferase involved in cell wall biosynthesis